MTPLMTRIGGNLRQFIKFGIVGGSGALVNTLTVVAVKKFLGWIAGISEHAAVLNLFGTQFHIRWYHVFMALAFLAANTWNYQLNRMWTFKARRAPWWRGYFSFLLAGVTAFIVSAAVATALMNPTSPIALPDDIFDDSTGFRTKLYWSNVISILVAMPVNFIISKLWTFRGSRVVHETQPT